MRVALICEPARLPPLVQALLARLPDALAREVCGTDATVDATVDVQIPFDRGVIAGVYVLGRLGAGSALPPRWSEDLGRRLAAFATALPERLERHLAETRRRPFAAAHLREQFHRRLDRQALALLAEAEAAHRDAADP